MSQRLFAKWWSTDQKYLVAYVKAQNHLHKISSTVFSICFEKNQCKYVLYSKVYLKFVLSFFYFPSTKTDFSPRSSPKCELWRMLSLENIRRVHSGLVFWIASHLARRLAKETGFVYETRSCCENCCSRATFLSLEWRHESIFRMRFIRKENFPFPSISPWVLQILFFIFCRRLQNSIVLMQADKAPILYASARFAPKSQKVPLSSYWPARMAQTRTGDNK